MFGWNALFVTVTGTGAGALIAAGPLIVIDKLETGTAAPYIPPAQAVTLIASVAVLTTVTIMASLRAMPGRRG